MKALEPFTDPIDGLTFVEASAGTGKTYAIEMFYLRLLIEEHASPEEVIVVTYTNAAAAELRQRARDRIRRAQAYLRRGGAADEPWKLYLSSLPDTRSADQRLLAALYGFDRAAISTIHGFCQRILSEHAFVTGNSFDLDMITDQAGVVDEVVRDFIATELFDVERPLLETIWRRGSMSDLVAFAGRCASQPDLVLTPEPSEWRDPLAKWREALDQARESWRLERAQITEKRLSSPGLKKNAMMSEEVLAGRIEMILSPTGLFTSSRKKALDMLSREGVRSRTKKGQSAPQHRFFDYCQTLVETEPLWRNAFQTHFYHELARFSRRELSRRKADAGVAYFDDLLLNLHQALTGENGAQLAGVLRGRYKAALIDEFQDTDPVQYKIFRAIFADSEGRSAGHPMMLIGDPKQSIYAFRGGDIHTYVAARESATRIATLDTNRRSAGPLVQALNTLFALPNAFVLDAIRFQPAQVLEQRQDPADLTSGLTILHCAKEESLSEVQQVSRGVASRIVKLLESGARVAGRDLGPGDIAVLCRKNSQAAMVQEELRRRLVPTVLQGDRSVFESLEADEVMRVLRSLNQPRDVAALRAALCTQLCGVNGDELLAMRDGDGEWQEWSDRVRSWRRRWDESGFMAAFRQLRRDCRSDRRILAGEAGERQLTNFLHLGELVQVAARRRRCGPQGILDWFALMCNDAGARTEMSAEDVQVRLESDDDAVTLTTIHKSKGLEYPVVFLPFLCAKAGLKGLDDTLPTYYDERQGRMIYVGAPLPPQVKERAAVQSVAEEMRLAYVGLTRAQYACFAVLSSSADSELSPLGRLVGGDLDGLVSRACGTIAVEQLEVSSRSLRAVGSRVNVCPPPPAPEIDRSWRATSFSGLTQGHEHLSGEEEEGVDRDRVGEQDQALQEHTGERILLADLEKGTRVGLMLHSVLEDLDFCSDDSEAWRALVDRKCLAYRCGGASIDQLCRALGDVVQTPLKADSCSIVLADVAVDRRLDELEFLLPVSGTAMCPSNLAAVLRRHGAPTPDPSYAERVAVLGFTAFSGFLRGYVDMVFEHAGRWYVVDYKSNYLGEKWSAYEAESLVEPMSRHDYFLQYLIYVVAVDRHLRRCVDGYSYEKSFGGVFYLFLRGMTKEIPGNGVYYDRPSAALVSEISELFAGTTANG